MRKILLGATVLAAAGAVLVVNPARADYVGGSCSYATTSTTVAGNGVGVQAGPGGMPGTAAAEVGACLELATPVTAGPQTFAGGAVGAGGGLNPNPNNRLCFGVLGGGTSTTVPAPVGVYAVADGNNANNNGLGGYAGVSNYEDGATETGNPPGPGCEPENGSGSNSGGSVGVTAAGVYLPVPLVVCGNDSGPNWSNTGRDGCFVDTTN